MLQLKLLFAVWHSLGALIRKDFVSYSQDNPLGHLEDDNTCRWKASATHLTFRFVYASFKKNASHRDAITNNIF